MSKGGVVDRENAGFEPEGWHDYDDDYCCGRCGGDGYIMACDGDGSDWGEDTYSGPMDATIPCRACAGTGVLK